MANGIIVNKKYISNTSTGNGSAMRIAGRKALSFLAIRHFRRDPLHAQIAGLLCNEMPLNCVPAKIIADSLHVFACFAGF